VKINGQKSKKMKEIHVSAFVPVREKIAELLMPARICLISKNAIL